MENSPLTNKISRLSVYMPKAIKFYNLKIEFLTPLLFILILAISLSDVIIPLPKSINLGYSLLFFFGGIILSLANSIYLCAYMMELKEEAYSFEDILKVLGRNLYKLVILSFIYNIPVMAISCFNKSEYLNNTALQATLGGALFVLLIPGIIFYLMFIFNTCFILDKNSGVIKSFLLSKRISKGNKGAIFKTIFLFNMLLLIPAMFITLITISAYPNNSIITNFVFYFVLTIINFIQQRLIALMYLDLEYGSIGTKQKV